MTKRETSNNVIIATNTGEYSSVIPNIKCIGGEVKHQFEYVQALSVTVPTNKIPLLTGNTDIMNIYLDAKRSVANSAGESPMSLRRGENEDSLLVEPAMLTTEDYGLNSATPEELIVSDPANYRSQWGDCAATSYGMDSLVVIIDTNS